MRDITELEIATEADKAVPYEMVLNSIDETPFGPMLLRHFKAVSVGSV